MLRLVHRLVTTLLVLALAGCLPEPDPIGQIPPPPASCGNKTCEPAEGESCVNCPQDCSCCSAALATGTVANPELAVGSPDGKKVTLGEYQSLELALARSIDDQGADGGFGAELELVGEILSGEGKPTGCTQQAGSTGLVVVEAKGEDGWRQIGLWGKGGSSLFDLGCGLVRRASTIRLLAQQGTAAQLDAVRLPTCK